MKFVNYAHRGASEYFPENTMRSFYAGLEMGADGIETDIQRTLDGVLVLYHDDTLRRIVMDDRNLCQCTYQELLKMDFGRWMGEAYAGERIVTLDTFLNHFGRRDIHLALELKQIGIEQDCLECVNKYECRENVTFTSFHWESLLALRKIDSVIDIGFLTDRITEEIIRQLKQADIGQICPRIDLVNESDMALARANGLFVRFWGVRNEQDMWRALALQGDGTTCNFPDKLAAVLRTHV